MANILTEAEAVAALRLSDKSEEPNFNMFQSAVDESIQAETGHNWAADENVDPIAKFAASMLIICMRDGTKPTDFYWGKITELHAKAKKMIADATV